MVEDLLNDEEMNMFRDVFTLFDKDKDGTITTNEFALVYRALGQNPSEAELENMLKEIGMDHKKRIDFDDFTSIAIMGMKKKDDEMDVREAFRNFDRQGCSLISVRDLRYIMTNLGEKLTDKEVDEMLTDADVDSDGFLNYEDLVSVMCSK